MTPWGRFAFHGWNDANRILQYRQVVARMNWVRWHHGTATDPKWRVVVTRCNACNASKFIVRISDVLAVWSYILEAASANETARGTVSGWAHEDVGAALELPAEAVERIWAAMQGKVLDGQRLTGWTKRNPKREDDSVERVRKYRERNALEKDVTRGNARGEERREEKRREDTTYTP